ncbi:hypothetical protein ZEAMMB73_Zm00001d006546 [Zea mays]|uniref:Uncharacterized protein n=1 Tax=Zea mays TaxID=4577 RepID=A0A1D6EXL6_MAIZE|nr:hypothetical protein ZEAMMB73_Zm00001d006546 [Zea mays]
MKKEKHYVRSLSCLGKKIDSDQQAMTPLTKAKKREPDSWKNGCQQSEGCGIQDSICDDGHTETAKTNKKMEESLEPSGENNNCEQVEISSKDGKKVPMKLEVSSGVQTTSSIVEQEVHSGFVGVERVRAAYDQGHQSSRLPNETVFVQGVQKHEEVSKVKDNNVLRVLSWIFNHLKKRTYRLTFESTEELIDTRSMAFDINILERQTCKSLTTSGPRRFPLLGPTEAALRLVLDLSSTIITLLPHQNPLILHAFTDLFCSYVRVNLLFSSKMKANGCPFYLFYLMYAMCPHKWFKAIAMELISVLEQIHRRMVEIMVNQASTCDLKELVSKFIP